MRAEEDDMTVIAWFRLFWLRVRYLHRDPWDVEANQRLREEINRELPA